MSLNPKLLPPNMLRCISPEDREPLGKAGQTPKETFALQSAQSERELQDQIASYLRIKGVRMVFSSRMDKRTTNRVGQPDFIFVYHGRPVGLEVKLPGREATDEQRRVMQDMLADGWTVAVVRSLDDVIKTLRGLT